MDPITTAILAAAPVIASELVGSAVKDAYVGLRGLIQRKWGADSAIHQAVDAVEVNPQSKPRAAVLDAEDGKPGAHDPRVVLAAAAKPAEQRESADALSVALGRIK